ncbi:MAG: SWIM zinc finger family protein [Thermoplasmata archaeon]
MEYDEADPRQIRALALLSLGPTIEHHLRNEWRMPSSQKDGGVYRIRRGRTQWSCTCKDNRIRGLLCKHIHAVRFHLAREKGEQLVPIKKDPPPKVPRRTLSQTDEEVEKPKCPHCAGQLVIRYGRPNGKQAWWCKHCLRKFVPDDGFKRLKGDAQTITLALDLYFKGLSLRQITDTLVQFYNIQVSHVTVYRWLKRYVDILAEFGRALRPSVGGKWNCDEMKVKYGSNWNERAPSPEAVFGAVWNSRNRSSLVFSFVFANPNFSPTPI